MVVAEAMAVLVAMVVMTMVVVVMIVVMVGVRHGAYVPRTGAVINPPWHGRRGLPRAG